MTKLELVDGWWLKPLLRVDCGGSGGWLVDGWWLKPLLRVDLVDLVDKHQNKNLWQITLSRRASTNGRTESDANCT